MTTIQAAANVAANAKSNTAATSSPVTSASGLDTDFQTFLEMMTTQIKNQDPLNPIESQDFSVQLATFAGVEQQVRSNTLLAALGDQLEIGGLAQMAGWVGMEARATIPAHFNGEPITIIPETATASDRAELVVSSEDGEEVQRLDLPIPVPDGGIVWAGVAEDGTPLPSGKYEFSVESFLKDNLISAERPDISGRVAEVRTGQDGVVLVMANGIEVSVDAVKAVRDPA